MRTNRLRSSCLRVRAVALSVSVFSVLLAWILVSESTLAQVVCNQTNIERRIECLLESHTDEVSGRLDQMESDMADILDNQEAMDLKLDELISFFPEFSISAELCAELSLELAAGVDIGFESGLGGWGKAGADVYGSGGGGDAKVEFATTGAAGVGGALAVPAALCVSTDDDLENLSSEIETFLLAYKDAWEDHLGMIAELYGNANLAVQSGADLIENFRLPTDPSEILNGPEANELKANMAQLANLFPLGDDIRDLLANPTNFFDAMPEGCEILDELPPGGLKDQVQAFCDDPPFDDLDEARAQVEGLVAATGKLDTIVSDVGSMVGDVTSILGYVDDINWSDISTIKDDVGNIRGTVDGIDGTVDDICSKVDCAAPPIDDDDELEFEPATYEVDKNGSLFRSGSDQMGLAAGEGLDTRLSVGIPTDYALEVNYPNPFNPTTKIRFALPEAGNVRLQVYDMTGRRVATLLNRSMDAGVHQVAFDAANLASGTYMYQIEAGGYLASRTMVLSK